MNSWKYLRSSISGSKDIGVRKSEFVAKTQILWIDIDYRKYGQMPKF